MNASVVLEDILYQFLKKNLSPADIRNLSCRADILAHVDEETEDEMKTELYNTFIRNINSRRLIDSLVQSVEGQDESESESDEEEEDED
jgi:RecA-family ATPase